MQDPTIRKTHQIELVFIPVHSQIHICDKIVQITAAHASFNLLACV